MCTLLLLLKKLERATSSRFLFILVLTFKFLFYSCMCPANSWKYILKSVIFICSFMSSHFYFCFWKIFLFSLGFYAGRSFLLALQGYHDVIIWLLHCLMINHHHSLFLIFLSCFLGFLFLVFRGFMMTYVRICSL